jgi:ABC-type sugar transport system substrate-binding protein
MKSMRVSLAALVAIAAFLSAVPTPARAAPGNAVTDWNLIAVTTLIGSVFFTRVSIAPHD